MCQIWMTGTQIPNYKTEAQQMADEVRRRDSLCERYNHVLREADIYDLHDDIHYVIEEPTVNWGTNVPPKHLDYVE